MSIPIIKKHSSFSSLTLFCTLSNITGCDWEFASLTDCMRRTIDAQQAWSGRLWKAGAAWNFRAGKKFRARTVESAAETQRKRLVKSTEQ